MIFRWRWCSASWRLWFSKWEQLFFWESSILIVRNFPTCISWHVNPYIRRSLWRKRLYSPMTNWIAPFASSIYEMDTYFPSDSTRSLGQCLTTENCVKCGWHLAPRWYITLLLLFDDFNNKCDSRSHLLHMLIITFQYIEEIQG